MEDVELGGGDFEFSEKSIRHAFIKKVYGILTIQLILTFGLVCICCFIPSVQQYCYETPALVWSVFGVSMALLIVLACCPNIRRRAPLNMIFLLLFTLCEGFMVGFITASYWQYDGAKTVIAALVTTIILVFGLTLFAVQTKIDFTMKAGVLFAFAMSLMMFGIMAAIFRSQILYTMYAALATFLFGAYLVFDTQLIIGGKHKLAISPEEYIFAALNLYLDIINIFLLLLQLFGGNR